MPIIMGARQIVGDLAGEIASLEFPFSNLRRFGVGGNAGHPTRTYPVIRASKAWAMAPEHRWVRAYCRSRRHAATLPRDAGMLFSDVKGVRRGSR